jgi:hypothetical protein
MHISKDEYAGADPMPRNNQVAEGGEDLLALRSRSRGRRLELDVLATLPRLDLRWMNRSGFCFDFLLFVEMSCEGHRKWLHGTKSEERHVSDRGSSPLSLITTHNGRNNTNNEQQRKRRQQQCNNESTTHDPRRNDSATTLPT